MSKEFGIDLVVAYYKEDLDWINKYTYINFRRVYIYNKGPLEVPKLNIPVIEIKLDNIGRCDHTYLYHIINTYNDLANVTIFSTGSVSLSTKTLQFFFVANMTYMTNNSVFIGKYYNSVVNDNYNFTLDTWESSHKNNKEGANKLHLANIRPFGDWYNRHFRNIHINMINYYGIFSVSRAHIQQHPVAYYKTLLNEFPKHANPEVGHYFERSWVAIFHLIPQNCLYYIRTIIFTIIAYLLVFTVLLIYLCKAYKIDIFKMVKIT